MRPNWAALRLGPSVAAVAVGFAQGAENRWQGCASQAGLKPVSYAAALPAEMPFAAQGKPM